jgi:hypothetical protein
VRGGVTTWVCCLIGQCWRFNAGNLPCPPWSSPLPPRPSSTSPRPTSTFLHPTSYNNIHLLTSLHLIAHSTPPPRLSHATARSRTHPTLRLARAPSPPPAPTTPYPRHVRPSLRGRVPDLEPAQEVQACLPRRAERRKDVADHAFRECHVGGARARCGARRRWGEMEAMGSGRDGTAHEWAALRVGARAGGALPLALG